MSSFENQQVKLEIIDNVLHAFYKPGLKITIQDAQAIVQERLNLLNGQILPTIVFDGGVVSMDKAARDYFSSSDGTRGIKCAAIIENSFFSKTLINFFMKLTNTKIPVKAFGNKTEALEWIKSFK